MEATVCVWRMEGKCEDWVLVLKGGGKDVENVDVVQGNYEEENFENEKMELLLLES